MTQSNSEMPFWDHLEELRWRLIKSIITIFVGALVTYHYSDIVIYWLVEPVKSLDMDLNLQVLKITSMFTIKLSVALFGGMIAGFPVIIYQFWRFISPAFDAKHGISVLLTILFSSFFFIIGMSFSYFIIIPFSLSFFTSLTSDLITIDYNFTLEGYLIYVLWLIFGCGLVFQLPVISIFFTRIGIFTPEFLKQYRKYAIIISLILSAMLTPPDPMSQVLIVLPLLGLYELSILISKFLKSRNSLI